MSSNLPKSWKVASKPHKFCPGCGQSLALKILGFAIDEMGIQDKMVYGCDIGCSLLTWNMFDVDTIQTHHGRVLPTMIGFKKANPKAIVLAFMGDGGGYAIGAQHLINSCNRNDNVSIILINNANYAMTGGQASPTTIIEQKTTTTPTGKKFELSGNPFHGPEMLTSVAASSAYIARAMSNDFNDTKEKIKKVLQNQIDGNGFSFLEILAMCPVNWKTNTPESIQFVEEEMTKIYPLGELKCPEK